MNNKFIHFFYYYYLFTLFIIINKNELDINQNLIKYYYLLAYFKFNQYLLTA